MLKMKRPFNGSILQKPFNIDASTKTLGVFKRPANVLKMLKSLA
jgi:hypothetical protein